jgi:hypothetical protein
MQTLPADHPDAVKARHWGQFYRQRGFNPLPSRMDTKRPYEGYRQFWDQPAPPELFDRWPTSNIQCMCGRRWRLLVIDLDGPEARDWFAAPGSHPRTWVTHSGGDGLHLWFRLPAGLEQPIPSGILWRGDGEHRTVERKCDKSLIVVPPSIHPNTKERYRFTSKRESPAGMPLPALVPDFVMAMKPIRMNPTGIPAIPIGAIPTRRVDPALTGRYTARDVLQAIPDKASVAARAGLRLAASQPNAAGWLKCHAIDREDRNPSASFHPESGCYSEPGAGVTLRFFDLLVALNAYSVWTDAVADLGHQYRARSAG